jgi:hypothetical protein
LIIAVLSLSPGASRSYNEEVGPDKNLYGKEMIALINHPEVISV